MLVLMRKVGERVIINGGTSDEIIVEVVKLLPHGVRLGFIASPSVPIYREEVQAQIDKDQSSNPE